eukprot:SAG11_NODE_6470_length_1306_cov_1.505385_1_plen_175_part_10
MHGRVAWIVTAVYVRPAQYGLDGALYLAYLRQCSLFWLVQTGICCFPACIMYELLGNRVSLGDEGIPIYALSMANVDPFSASGFFSVFVGFYLMCSGIAFAVWRNKQMDKLKLSADDELHTSRCTLWVKNVPIDVTDESLNQWLEDTYPGEIAGASIALNVHELGADIRSQKKLI